MLWPFPEQLKQSTSPGSDATFFPRRQALTCGACGGSGMPCTRVQYSRIAGGSQSSIPTLAPDSASPAESRSMLVCAVLQGSRVRRPTLSRLGRVQRQVYALLMGAQILDGDITKRMTDKLQSIYADLPLSAVQREARLIRNGKIPFIF